MRLRDDLLRAAIYASGEPELAVWAHRIGPLVEHAHRLQTATDAEAAIEGVVTERTTELLNELRASRRQVALLEGRLVALGELS